VKRPRAFSPARESACHRKLLALLY
jgi:hypothetical protein